MSSIRPPTSPSQVEDNTIEKGDRTPVVTRGAVIYDNSRVWMNLSAFEDGADLIRDVDYTSSSSSSGIVSSSTVDKDYFDEDIHDFGDTSNIDRSSYLTNTDCLAFRRPWATPPTALSESSKLQIGGIASK